MFWEELISGIPQIGCFQNFKDQIIEFTTKFLQIYLLCLKNCFLQNAYIFKKNLYFLSNTNIFCVKIYIFEMRYMFITFSFIFFSVKEVFFSKTIFHYKTVSI